MANHEILTNISQRWAEMSPEEKETYNRRQEEAKAVYKKEKTEYDAMKAGVEVPVQVTEPAASVGDKRATKKKVDVPATPSTVDSPVSSSDSSEESSDDDDEEEEKVVVTTKGKKQKKSPQTQNPPAKQKVPAQTEKKEKKRKTKE